MKYRWSFINVLVIILFVWLGMDAWLKGDESVNSRIAFAYFIPIAIGALLLDLILQALIPKRKWLLVIEIVIVVATGLINNMK